MTSSKSTIIRVFCVLQVFALSIAHPLLEESAQYNDEATVYMVDDQNWSEDNPSELFVRHVRSPSSSGESSKEDNRRRIQIKYENTKAGREGSITYNQNLLKSDDGSFSLDAYAQGRRNYDWNRNEIKILANTT
nr:uncharacterized protein LOC106620226 isoform X2 [Bactrocera oleae]